MASIEAVELGASFGELGVGVAGVVAAEGMVVEVRGVEGPALLVAPPRAKSPANLARFSSIITMVAPEESKLKHAQLKMKERVMQSMWVEEVVKGTYTQVLGKGGGVAPMLDKISSVENHAQVGQDLACFAAG